MGAMAVLWSFLGGAEASASPSFALPMFITIKKIIILHLFLGVPAATVGGTGTPWHTRGYAPCYPLSLIKKWRAPRKLYMFNITSRQGFLAIHIGLYHTSHMFGSIRYFNLLQWKCTMSLCKLIVQKCELHIDSS